MGTKRKIDHKKEKNYRLADMAAKAQASGILDSSIMLYKPVTSDVRIAHPNMIGKKWIPHKKRGPQSF